MKLPHILVSGQAGHGKDSVGSYLTENYGYLRTAFGDPVKDEIMDNFAPGLQSQVLASLNTRECKELPSEKMALSKCLDREFIDLALRLTDSEDHKILGFFKQAILSLKSENLDGLILMDRPASDYLSMECWDLDSRLTLPRSFRRTCQLWGTEYKRKEKGNDNYWVDQIADILNNSDSPVVITDGRGENECSWAEASGVRRIHVSRPGWAEFCSNPVAVNQGFKEEVVTSLKQWLNAPTMENGLRAAQAQIRMMGQSGRKHQSEIIPEVTETTKDIVNEGSLEELHEKVEEALGRFIREDRPKLFP